MILLDANLLLYAYDSASEHHNRAKRWLEQAFSGNEPVRIAWVTVLAFLRISTNYRAFESPFSIKQATSIVAEWLGHPLFSILDPGERYWEIFRSLLTGNQVSGPLVMDADLATLAIKHGAVLYTTNRDFARFPNLKMVNPIPM